MLSLLRRFEDVMLMSLRPLHLVLGFEALVVASVILYTGQFIPTTEMSGFVNSRWLGAAFALYAIGTLTMCVTVSKSIQARVTRYAVSTSGVVLWSFAFVAEVMFHGDGFAVLRVTPVLLEGWTLARLLSNLATVDRRAL